MTSPEASFAMAGVIKNPQSVSHCLRGSGSQSVIQGLLGVEECKDSLGGIMKSELFS